MKTGDVVGKYRLLSVLGRGGEGRIFLAVHMQTEQLWTLKLLGREKNEEQAREVRMLRSLHHPGLPVLVDVLDTSDGTCMVLEYVRGKNLETVMKQRGPFKQEQVIETGLVLCSALDYMHSRKPPVLHLDLKPSNIMLTEQGRIKLLDLGAAERADRPERVRRGTDGFAAPEQYDVNRMLDQRADVYGVGAVLYYLISGKYFPENNRQHSDGRCNNGQHSDEQYNNEQHSNEGYDNGQHSNEGYDNGQHSNERYGNGQHGAERHKNGQHGAERHNNGQSCSRHFRIGASGERTTSGPDLRLSGCPDRLARVLARCLETDPEKRYRSCRELQRALSDVGKHTGTVRRRMHAEAALLLGVLAMLVLKPGLSQEFRSGAEEVFDYDRTLEQAACAQDEERMELYRKAFFMEPADPAAYEQMLEEAGADGIFDEEEERQVRQILNTIPPGETRTYEELLEEEPSAAARVFWKLGLLYRFEYQQESAGRIAHSWLSRAVELGRSCEQVPDWVQSAILIDRLSGYTSSTSTITIPSVETQAEKAGQWWKDLMELSRFELRAELSRTLMLRLSLDCMNKLLTGIGYISEAGVMPDELEKGLDMLVEMVGGDLTGSESVETEMSGENQVKKDMFADEKEGLSTPEDQELRELREQWTEREKEIRVQIEQIRKQRGA